MSLKDIINRGYKALDRWYAKYGEITPKYKYKPAKPGLRRREGTIYISDDSNRYDTTGLYHVTKRSRKHSRS